MAESSIYEGYKQLKRRGSYEDEIASGIRAGNRQALYDELNRDRTWGERASDFAIGGLQGAVSLGSSAYGLGNMATGGGLEWATGMADNFERTNQILQNAKSTQLLNSLNRANQAFDQRGILAGVKEYITSPELMVDLGATNAASVLPAAAGGMWAANRAMQAAGTLGTTAARAAATKAATRTATLVGGAQAGGAAYTEAYNQAIAEGLSPEEANLRAQGAGYATAAATAAISRMPGIGAARTEGEVIANLAKAPSPAAAAKGFGSSLATATRAETTEEFFQSGVEQGIQNIASTERELFDDVGKAAAVGGLGGGVLGVAMGSVPATRQLRSDLTNIMDESAREAGVDDAAKSGLQEEGERVIEAEADAAQQTTQVLRTAAERLADAGFIANDDGATFTLPADPERVYTVDEALELVAAGRVTQDTVLSAEEAAQQQTLMDMDRAAREAGFVPDEQGNYWLVDEAGDPRAFTLEEAAEQAGFVPEEQLSVPSLTPQQARGYRAYGKTRATIESLGMQREVVDGREVFVTTDQNGGRLELDLATVAELLRQSGQVTDTEAAEATRYAELLNTRRSTGDTAPAPRTAEDVGADPRTPPNTALITGVEQMEARQDALRQQALEAAGLIRATDGTYWQVDDEGNPTLLEDYEANAIAGYRDPRTDMFGGPLYSPVDVRQPPDEPDPVEASTQPTAPSLPGMDLRQPATGYRAYARVNEQLGAIGVQHTVVAGEDRYTMDDGTGNTIELDMATATELLSRAGGATPQEIAEARAYVTRLPGRSTVAPRTPEDVGASAADVGGAPLALTEALDQQQQRAIEAVAQREFALEEDAIQRAGMYPDDDGVYWAEEDGELVRYTRDEALEQSAYVSEGEDLLGDPVDLQEMAAAEEAPTQTVEETGERRAYGDFEYVPEQMPLRGLSPLQDAVYDQAQVEALEDEWMAVLERAVAAREEAGSQISFNASMRRSRIITDFIDGAVANGIVPNSPESFDYIAEQARAAATSSSKAAEVVGAAADLAAVNDPGTASIARWRKALVRRGVATLGQMRGPAYQKFKAAAEKAKITPASSHFDTFMQGVSDRLTNAEADTPFGKALRAEYPKTPRTPAKKAEAQTKAKAVKGKQVATGSAKAAKPVMSPEVADITKTAQEAAVTEPVPEPAPAAKGKKAKKVSATNEAKKAVRNAVNEASIESEAAINAMHDRMNALREANRNVAAERRAATPDMAGADDVDAAVAEAELARSERQQMSEAAAADVNAIIYEAEQRIESASAKLTAMIARLKEQFIPKNTSKGERDELMQGVLTKTLENQLRLVDLAIAKDASGSLAGWAGSMGAVLQDSDYQSFADNRTKYDEFIGPMLDRFKQYLVNNRSADAVRVKRAVFENTGVVDFIMDELGGQFQQEALTELATINRIMDRAIERLTVDPAKPNNVKPFKTNDGKYSVNPGGTPQAAMPIEELRALVDQWNSNRPEGAAEFTLFETVQEAQEATGLPMPSAANGVYYAGQTYIIAENIADRNMAAEVILHERTHGGLEALLGTDRLPAVMNRLWANPQLRRRIQAKMLNSPHQMNRIVAAEEVLVDMIVGGEKLNKSTFSKIRAAVSQMVDRFLGIPGYIAPDSMVNELLKDTADYLRGAKSELNMSESYVDDIEAFQAIFEGRSVLRGPLFSVAATEASNWSQGGESDVTKFQNAHVKALKESVANNLGELAKTSGKSTARRVKRFAMDFLPASQIADLNRGLFWDGGVRVDLLQQFVDDKVSKANEYNKTLNKKRKLHYNYDKTTGKAEAEFNESIVEIIREWNTTKNKQKDQMNVVQQMGTMYKVYPDRSWDQQSTLDYDKQGFTEADRRQVYNEVRAAWNSLSEQNKTLYRKVQAVYASLWSERMTELRNQNQRIAEASTTLPDPDDPDTMIQPSHWKNKMNAKISLAMSRIAEGPYSPLSRFGDYYIVAKNKRGEVVYSSGHDSEVEAKAVMDSILRQLPEETDYEISMSVAEEYNSMDAMSVKHYEQIRKALEHTFPGSDESDSYARKHALATMKEVLLQTLPDHSLLKHANTRRGVAGTSMDSFRAFNDYAVKSARNLASMRYDHKIQGALSRMSEFAREAEVERDGRSRAEIAQDRSALQLKRREVLNAIRRQHLESQRAQGNWMSGTATTISSAFYMTSPSQMFLNMSQTALVTMPVLASRYGIGSTMKYMGEASAEFAKSGGAGIHSDRGKLQPGSAMAAVMSNLNDIGTLDFTQAHDINDMAQGDSNLMHTRKRAAMHAAFTFMRQSEIYNREVAAFIAVRGEMRRDGVTEQQFQSMSDAEKAPLVQKWTSRAKQAAEETQYIYDQTNRPKNMQSNIGRVVFQFQQFRVNTLALLYRYTRDSFMGVRDPSLTTAEQEQATWEARKTLAYLMVTQLGLTGAMGSVVAPVVFFLANMAFGDDDDLLTVEEQFQQHMPSLVTHGLIGQVLDSQRFGFNTLIPVLSATKYMPVTDSPKDTLNHYATNSLGPAWAIGTQAAEGMSLLAEGKWERAAGMIMPKALSDIWRVVNSEADNFRDRQGIQWYERSGADQFWNVLGIRTADQQTAAADRAAIYSGTKRATNRRSSLISRWVTAPDYESRQEAYAAISQWNQRYGGDSQLVVKTSTLKQAAKTYQQKQLNAIETGVPSTQTPDTVLRMVNDR